jgi:hypothetical protein
MSNSTNKMIVTNSIEQVRKDHEGVVSSHGRIAVIVETQYAINMAHLGVQFWTPDMIAIGAAINADRSSSKFVELL